MKDGMTYPRFHLISYVVRVLNYLLLSRDNIVLVVYLLLVDRIVVASHEFFVNISLLIH